MAILVGSYTDYEKALLVAAYYTSNKFHKDAVSIAEIEGHFEIKRDDRWLMRSLGHFSDSGWSSEPLFHTNDLSELRIELTSSGLREAEALIERNAVAVEPRDRPNTEVPASDRIVSFDHNAPKFIEIRAGLADVRETIRQANDISEAERDRILRSLDSAQTLWDATQLKIIQIKVGVLMAVEAAAVAVKATAKAVAIGILIDTIKAFVKNHTGIDLDHV